MKVRCLEIVVLILSLPTLALADGTRHSALSEAIAKTIKWPDQLKSYELEMVSNYNSENRSSRTNDATFTEEIVKMREIRDAASGKFVVCHTRGQSLFQARKGNDSVTDSNSMSIRHGDNDAATYLPLDSRASPSQIRCADIGGCIAAARDFDLGRLVLTFRNFRDSKGAAAELERALVIFMEADESQIHLLETKLNSKKRVKEYRLKKIVRMIGEEPDKIGLAYRITVSDEGFDKGLVLELFQGEMLPDEVTNEYSKQSQIRSDIEMSVSVDWKMLTSQKREVVLPTHVTQKMLNTKFSTQTIRRTLNWKNLEKVDDREFSIEAAEKVCRDFRTEIDKALRR